MYLIKINYTDQNGMKQSMQKKIEYTVANIQEPISAQNFTFTPTIKFLPAIGK